MGEQFIDLFSAGAYALCGRIFQALAQPGQSWIFLVLAATSLLYALVQSAVEERPGAWLRHLAMVALASVLTLRPLSFDLAPYTYAAPGRLEAAMATRTGAAPHLTVAVERLGSAAALAMRELLGGHASLIIPGVAVQVAALASDPGLIADPQLRANLQIWRAIVVPALMADPAFSARIQANGLQTALLDPRAEIAEFTTPVQRQQAQAVRAQLHALPASLAQLLAPQQDLLAAVTQAVDAQDWQLDPAGSAAPLIRFASFRPGGNGDVATQAPAPWADAQARGRNVAARLAATLPDAAQAVPVATVDALYERLARSVLAAAGAGLAMDENGRASVGSLCQRMGDAQCGAPFAALPDTSAKLRVAPADRYDTNSWTTLLLQPTASGLLVVTAALVRTLSSLVVSVMPFALGVAKAMAILVSVIGVWMLLWPGRAHVALTWMVAPIAFVSIWSVLFNIWAALEPAMSAIGTAASSAERSSLSAELAMSIAVSLGYLGLPSLAMGIVYGESGRALYHASARMENSLLLAWHNRSAILNTGKRWLFNSPLARRVNQRAYTAVGLGTLRGAAGAGGAARSGARKSSARPALSLPAGPGTGRAASAPVSQGPAASPAGASKSAAPSAKAPAARKRSSTGTLSGSSATGSRRKSAGTPAASTQAVPTQSANPRVKAIVTPRA